MKRKILIISLICILFIAISVTTFASKKPVEYDKNGKPLLYPGEDISDEIQANTPIGIVVDQSNSNFDYEKEKTEFENSAKESLPNIANYESDEEPEVDPFNAILQKYIGKEKVNELYAKISQELIGKNPQELSEYSQSQNELFNLLAQMLETKELTANEQEILKDGLKIIDISKLTNPKTVETINSFMAK